MSDVSTCHAHTQVCPLRTRPPASLQIPVDNAFAMDVLHAPGNVFRSSEDKVLEQQAGRQIRVVTGRQTDQQTGR